MAPPGVANCAGTEPNEAGAGAPTEPAIPVSAVSGAGGGGAGGIGAGAIGAGAALAAGLVPPPPPPPHALRKNMLKAKKPAEQIKRLIMSTSTSQVARFDFVLYPESIHAQWPATTVPSADPVPSLSDHTAPRLCAAGP